jgi:hypothetical protein
MQDGFEWESMCSEEGRVKVCSDWSAVKRWSKLQLPVDVGPPCGPCPRRCAPKLEVFTANPAHQLANSLTGNPIEEKLPGYLAHKKQTPTPRTTT